ncbi:MAG: TonB-dependent receptor family protein [Candidatus Aminicenantales bacterium]
MPKFPAPQRRYILLLPFLIVLLTVASYAATSGDGNAAAADKSVSERVKIQPQEAEKTTTDRVDENIEITVTAARVEIPLKQNPAATSIVETALLKSMPRTIAIDEALKLVPGVKVDNQADGERVHLSIRGQGILTERGTRGIKALVDGLPLNDPSGFVPDFFDVDWATVRRIEILRGPAAAFYGSGSSGGIINILTADGGAAPVSADAAVTAGSFGFLKGLAQFGGTAGIMNYRVSGSYTKSDGYRDHTDFWADNFSGKFKFDISPSVKVTALLGYTDFYNGNAEGLNLAWFSADPSTRRKVANPDSYSLAEYKKTPAWYREMFGIDRVPGNEFQQTGRFTGGLTSQIALADNLDLDLTGYFRHTKYTEAVPSSVIHRDYDTPGASLQLNHTTGGESLKNHLSAGVDFGGQTIDALLHPNLGDAVEGSAILADQRMTQGATGIFLLDRVELGPSWGASLSLRYDNVTCKVDDHIGSLSGDNAYKKATGRLGLTWNPVSNFGMYASWGTGFLPPGTEELANNPNAFGGFNKDLKPATSSGEEIGARGSLGGALAYDLAIFHLATDNDFGRFRISSRPLETFYGNVGSTTRYGLETSLAWYPVEPLALRLAYTYSHFKYDTVQTLDALAVYEGTWLPNSPQHQLYLDAEYKITPALSAGAALEYVSSWYIDSTNRVYLFNPELYPTVYYGKTDPYALVHVRLGYALEIAGAPWELFLSGRNIFGVEYYAFTEPDPDGNSYQPAATAEWTLGLRVAFGRH